MTDAKGSCTRRSFLGASSVSLALATFASTGSVDAQIANAEKATSKMNISGMVHVNINCSDFDRSRTFYEFLGFRLTMMVPPRNTPEVAAAVGMPPYHVKGALMSLPGSTTMIDLLEWKEPHDDSPPYPHLYHLGLGRIALATTDLDADVATLKSRGVEFLSEPARVGPSRFVCFKDPDGTILELVQMGA
ncbi:MAG: VOC family protein [Candidatus Hydrogenedentota bacterium]